ncbi:leucine-rich repeats and immunoglobulin-like domains protein 1 [Schistocerca piceifrons]|uniref:leucine-rich repeats and immunoglobulin-like domains protein 1 n=1 Tax=Schistocerca piceifrons TaxID=274613 RepID=UPI001F5F86E1|nr:leucine-rich repeats and immunoglobulin-like domains protein 1 [Schistocerca piceifrons]
MRVTSLPSCFFIYQQYPKYRPWNPAFLHTVIYVSESPPDIRARRKIRLVRVAKAALVIRGGRPEPYKLEQLLLRSPFRASLISLAGLAAAFSGAAPSVYAFRAEMPPRQQKGGTITSCDGPIGGPGGVIGSRHVAGCLPPEQPRCTLSSLVHAAIGKEIRWHLHHGTSHCRSKGCQQPSPVESEVVLQPDEPMPEFLAPLENLTATQGRDVTFTCVVNHLGKYKVAWIKSDSKAILAIHTHLVAHNPRLTVTHNGHNTWKLHINSVHQDDSGIYMCQVNTEPMRSQMGHLDVVVPPDILSNGSTDSATAPEGGTVRLRCVATGVPPSRVTWRREDAKEIVLRQEGGRDKQSVLYFEGETLTLTGVQRSDMGVYLCIASNGIPPSVSKRFPVTVLFAPLVKVSNQLVAAPVGSDVTINCYVEASPGALCTWHKDTGEHGNTPRS